MEIRLAPGDLLAAHLELDDPNFARTLDLVCQHDAEGECSGSY
ncbi:MAG: hypothetical protein R3F34_20090 [Planctomycetota bacterium]